MAILTIKAMIYTKISIKSPKYQRVKKFTRPGLKSEMIKERTTKPKMDKPRICKYLSSLTKPAISIQTTAIITKVPIIVFKGLTSFCPFSLE